jgi:uncharacterized protein (DUF433 family)
MTPPVDGFLMRGQELGTIGDERSSNNMAYANKESLVDWTACELIEQVPGKVSGRPIVRGTRIMPDGIVNSYDMGESIEEIAEDWPSLSADQIKRLIEFAHTHRGQPIP